MVMHALKEDDEFDDGERWIGITVSSESVTVVDALVPNEGPLVIQADDTWRLQKGDRSAAYNVMHQRVAEYLREHGVQRAVIKASALSLGGTKQAHLEAAELRGVVISAAASVTTTMLLAQARVSRTFGKRKVDEYVKDDGFWDENTSGELRAGSRVAAMMLLAARGKND